MKTGIISKTLCVALILLLAAAVSPDAASAQVKLQHSPEVPQRSRRVLDESGAHPLLKADRHVPGRRSARVIALRHLARR